MDEVERDNEHAFRKEPETNENLSWPAFGRKLLKQGYTEILGALISDYIDGVEKLLKKHKIFQKGKYIGKDFYDYDEVVINEIKIKGVMIYLFDLRTKKDESAIEMLKSAGIPITLIDGNKALGRQVKQFMKKAYIPARYYD